ncbi:uncharacterized protein DS421_6g195390 [Arachis hypogaea]|nr:uncharacterized protein DS421_6g195390 [Arachis hypogaea]
MNSEVVAIFLYAPVIIIPADQFSCLALQQCVLINQPSHFQECKIFKAPLAYICSYQWNSNSNPNPNLNLYLNSNSNPNPHQLRKIVTPPLLPSARTLQPSHTSENMLLLKFAIKNSMLKNGAIDEFTVKNNFIIRRKPQSKSGSRYNTSRQIKSSRLSTMSKAEDFDL